MFSSDVDKTSMVEFAMDLIIHKQPRLYHELWIQDDLKRVLIRYVLAGLKSP